MEAENNPENINVNKLFSPIEQICLMLHIASGRKATFENMGILQIVNPPPYNYDFYKTTCHFLVKRHENLRARYKINDDEHGSCERIYDDDYAPYVHPMIELNDLSTSDAFGNLYLKIEKLPLNMEKHPFFLFCLVKTLDGVFTIMRSPHALFQSHSCDNLHYEGLHIYDKIMKANGDISYEEATKDLAELPRYAEIVLNFDKEHRERKDKAKDYLRRTLENYDTSPKSCRPHTDSACDQTIEVINLINHPSEAFISQNHLRMNQVFRLLYQLAFFKVLGLRQPLLYNLNSQMDPKYKHVTCAFLRYHPIYFVVDEERTIAEQYKFNDAKNREMLEIFGPINDYFISAELNEEEGVPQGLFFSNFQQYTKDRPIRYRPDLRKVVPDYQYEFPENFYLEVIYCEKDNISVFSQYKLAAFSKEEHRKLFGFIVDSFNSFSELWDKKIKDI